MSKWAQPSLRDMPLLPVKTHLLFSLELCHAYRLPYCKLCEFLGFVWGHCLSNKSYDVAVLWQIYIENLPDLIIILLNIKDKMFISYSKL